MTDPIIIIASEEEVRDICYGVTGTEYSTEKIQPALKYGSALVATRTGVYDWSDSMPQYHIAVQAANYLAASNLIPKTFRDEAGKASWLTYYDSGLKEIDGINEGVVTNEEGGVGEGFIKIISSPSKNYYKNKDAKPWKSKEGWSGDYNTWNREQYFVEKLG